MLQTGSNNPIIAHTTTQRDKICNRFKNGFERTNFKAAWKTSSNAKV